MIQSAPTRPTLPRRRNRYRYGLNLPGIAYFAITILVGVAAVVRPNNILVWTFGFMLSLIGVGGLMSGAILFRLRVRRMDPGHGRVGRPLVVGYQIEGGSRWMPIFDLEVSESAGRDPGDWSSFSGPNPAWLMHAAPGQEAHAESVFVPRRRGRMRFDRIVARSSFPFGMLRKSVLVEQPMTTLIYPRTAPLGPAAVNRLLGRGGSGQRRRRPRPGLDDYLGLREYRDGDPRRSIMWKRWIDERTPAVVQRAESAPRRLGLRLDLRRSTETLRIDPETDGRELEESAITLAASIVESAIDQGVEVGLEILGVDHPDLGFRNGRRHLDRILAQFASIDLDLPRSTSRGRPSDPQGASRIVVHVDRIDPSVGDDETWHLLPSALRDLRELAEGSPSVASREPVS